MTDQPEVQGDPDWPLWLRNHLALLHRADQLVTELVGFYAADDEFDMLGYMEDTSNDVVALALCGAVARLVGVYEYDDEHAESVPHDARTEHQSPEQSPALLQAELDACRQEIARLRTSLAQANRTITDLQEHRK